jgi:acid phosphatase family membrane protein YuiD
MPYYLEPIVVPILCGLLAQVIKLATDQIKGNLNWYNIMNDYGGMPSSHTAMVVALATEMYLFEGFYTPFFAIALVVCIIVIRDALGFRIQVGIQSFVLNKIIKQLPLKDVEKEKLPLLKERMGHSIREVFGGAAIGIILPFLINWIIGLF